MARRNRSARGALVALVLAAVWAAPAAAAQPIRTPFSPDPGTISAGYGCSFDVLRQILPGAHDVDTVFSDGRDVLNAHGDVVMTNAITGKSIVHHANFSDTEWFDPSDGLVHGVTSGRFLAGGSPGDAGPFGVIGAPGALYIEVGRSTYAYDPNTFVTVQYSYTGTLTDVCALLS
jgi:hypothetical protein